MNELMENKIKELFEAIQNKQEEYENRANLFSADKYTLTALDELIGMKKAFEIVAGMSVIDYRIKTLEA